MVKEIKDLQGKMENRLKEMRSSDRHNLESISWMRAPRPDTITDAMICLQMGV